MNITIYEEQQGLVVVAPLERLDAFVAQDFRERVGEYLDTGVSNFVIDLSDTPFLDSAGMAVLVSVMKRCRQAGGDVSLVWPKHEPVKRILQLTRFDRVFDVYETRKEAVDAMLVTLGAQRERTAL